MANKHYFCPLLGNPGMQCLGEDIFVLKKFFSPLERVVKRHNPKEKGYKNNEFQLSTNLYKTEKKM